MEGRSRKNERLSGRAGEWVGVCALRTVFDSKNDDFQVGLINHSISNLRAIPKNPDP
jgi:hypothetical protein